MQWLELAAGALVVAVTLLDVFATVVVPGRAGPSLGIPKIVRLAILPAWRRARRALGGPRRDRIPSAFAGILLLLVFLAWVVMLMLGLGLMLHALRADFHPHLQSFPEAVFQAGDGMTTLGLGTMRPTGAVRPVVVLCGLCGLQVITLTLTYIVQLQMALQARDPLVVRLATRAGRPASPVRLLLTQKALGLEGRAGAMFDRWEAWTAELEQAQKAHPILAYFRSDEDHGDWVTALGAVLDAAVLAVLTTDGPGRGEAKLLLAGGTRTARALCALLRLDPAREGWQLDPAALAAGLKRLGAAGIPIAADPDAVERLRAPYAGSIAALARHFGVETPSWEAEPDAQWDALTAA